MPNKMLITKSKLDNLATIIGAKAEESLPLTIDQMTSVVQNKLKIPTTQEKTITPTTSVQIIKPDSTMQLFTSFYIDSTHDDNTITSTFRKNIDFSSIQVGDTVQITGILDAFTEDSVPRGPSLSIDHTFTWTGEDYHYTVPWTQENNQYDIYISPTRFYISIGTYNIHYFTSSNAEEENPLTRIYVSTPIYDGLSKVTVAAVPPVILQEKTVQSIGGTSGLLDVEPDEGYTGLSRVSITPLPYGHATTPNTTITIIPTILLNSSTGLITVSGLNSQQVYPTIQEGYINSSKAYAGTIWAQITDTSNNSYQLPTQSAATYNTSSSDQTISSGKYLTGTQIIKAVTTSGISAANIKNGATIKVGDANDDDRIIAVTGTFTKANTVSSGQTAATASQILSGYSAWVDGAEVQGSVTAKAAATYNLSSSDQTIAAGQYLSGAQTIRGVTTTGLAASNIRDGITIQVGDANDSARVAAVTGTFTDSSTVSSGQTAATASQILSGYSAWVDATEVKGNITSKAAATYNTSTSDQTITSGQYLSGTQTIKAVTTSGIEAANIKDGTVVKVGDANSATRIKNVTGTFTDASTVSSGQTAATASQILSGYSAWVDATEIKGNITTKTSSDLTASGATVTVPAGFYATDASKSVSTGSITPSTANTGLSTYFNSGTSSDNNVSITPQYTNTAGYVAAHSTAQSGTAEYYKIKTATPTFDGGTLSGSSTAVGTNVTLSSTNNSIQIRTKYTASRTAIQYNGAVEGWVNKADDDEALASASLGATYGTTYYVTALTVPKNTTFNRLTINADTEMDDTSTVFVTNNAYRQLEITNNLNGETNINNKGTTNVFAYNDTEQGDTYVSARLTSNGAVSRYQLTHGTLWIQPEVTSGGTYIGYVVVPSGSATTPATSVTANPSITVSDAGLITATASATKSVTPTVSAGYVSSGTAGTITVSGSNTSQLSTQAGKTVTPTESEQTAVTAGKYTTGAVKVAAISTTYVGSGITQNTSSNLSASGATVTAPAGYYANAATYTIGSGSVTPTIANSGLSTYFNSGTSSDKNLTLTPQYTNTAGYLDAHSTAQSGTATYYKIKTTSVSQGTTTISSGTVTRGTASWGTGWVSSSSIAAATFANDVASGKTASSYVDISDTEDAPVLVSGGYLYINKGYTDDLKISLAKLVPDEADVGTATSSANILTGHSAYNNNGQIVAGSMPVLTLPTSTSASATSGYTSKATISRSTSDQYINIAPGYNSAGGYYKINAVANGSVTSPTSISGSSATLSTGTNTLTLTKTISVTPNVTTAGYISTGTAGNATVTLTASVTTKAAATYYPSASDQTVAASQYLTGAQTIKAVTHTVTAVVVKSGTTVKIGDTADDDRVASISGTFTASSTVSSGQTAAAAGQILSGYSAWVDGVEVKGNIASKTSINLSANGATVTAPAGYYATDATYTIGSGAVTPTIANTGLSTYFNSSTSSDKNLTLTPQYTNTAGYITAHSTAQSGTAAYYKIKTATPAFDGGTLTGGSTATGTNVTLSSTDNGIKIQTKYTASREAIAYNGAVEGWVSQADDTEAFAAGSLSSTNGTAYYVTAVTIPKDKGFTITTTADTALDTTSDLDITNNAYRRVDITNTANGTVIIANSGNATVSSGSTTAGNLTVTAYNASGTSEANKSIVSSGKWVATSVSASGTYYGRVTVSAGSVTAPSTISGSSATVTTGTNTVTFTQSISVTPNVTTAGYISSGTAGTASVSLTASINTRNSSSLSASGATVTAPAGYYAADATKTIDSGTVTPSISNSGLSTYFNSGTSSDNNVTLTPQYTNTAGYVAAHSTAQSGTAVYYKIKTATPAFDGGDLTGGSTATGTNVTLSTTDNGMKVQTAYTANRAAVLYNGAVSGWVTAADNASALAAGSLSSTNGTAYYVTAVTMPKDKGFTVTTTADTALDTTSDLDVTNNAYRRVDITNNANGTVIIANSGNITVSSGSTTAGNLTVTAYNSSGTSEANKSIVSAGKWVATSVSASGTYYGRVTVGSGSATAPASISGTSATISTGSGTITLTKTVSVTPSVTAGYVSSGTAGNSSVSLTASVTVNPTPTASGATVTIPAGYYTAQATKSVTTMTLPTAATSSATSGYTSKATISRSTADQYINIPPGYNSAGGYYKISAVANGSATAPSTISGTSATISTGTNTITLSKTISITPTVSAGYVSSGTATNATVSLTADIADGDSLEYGTYWEPNV